MDSFSPGGKGNTPAYAGKTDLMLEAVVTEEKHPRLRGEDSSVVQPASLRMETPPLTRGRLLPLRIDADRVGNTPAYAGKTKQTAIQ